MAPISDSLVGQQRNGIEQQQRRLAGSLRSHEFVCCEGAERCRRPASYSSLTSRQCARNALSRCSGVRHRMAAMRSSCNCLASFDSIWPAF